MEDIQNLELSRDCLPVGPLYLEAGMPMKIYEAWYLGTLVKSRTNFERCLYLFVSKVGLVDFFILLGFLFALWVKGLICVY